MSNDLIDRMDAIENIWTLFNNTYNDASRFDTEETVLAKRILSDVQMVLEKRPTAYDVEKVVEKIADYYDLVPGWALKEIIEIIKSSGIR